MGSKNAVYFIAKILLLVAAMMALSGCITDIWTGASLIYDRHHVYKQLSDYQLGFRASHMLSKDQFYCTNCSIDIAVFNGDILLAGQVPTEALRKEAVDRMEALPKHRRVFNQLSVSTAENDTLQDGWITTKIRSLIFADSDIDPHQFKIVTSHRIVYLMGNALPKEADKVIDIARKCEGVIRVVTLFRYCHFSDKPVALGEKE